MPESTDRSETPRARTAGLVLIGNELLSGKVQDANGAYVIRQLRRNGIDLEEMHVVADNVEAIAEAINIVRGRRDICIASGGIGPTHDDVTMDGLAAAFSMQLETRADLVRSIDAVFSATESRNAWRKMAIVPTGTVMIPVGTVWPVYSVENVYALPGIPEIFRRQIDGLLKDMASDPVVMNVAYFSIGEGELAASLKHVADDFNGQVNIGSYPVLGAADYQVKVTLDSRDTTALERATAQLLAYFPKGVVHELIEHASPDVI